MSDQQRPEDKVNGRKFSEMAAGEKLAHLGKLIIFLCTFGFAFPNILSE